MIMSEPAKYRKRSLDRILKLRGQKRSPEQVARMKAAQVKRRTLERETEGGGFIFRHSIDRRLIARSYSHSPETLERMRVAQAKRRADEKEIKNMGVI